MQIFTKNQTEAIEAEIIPNVSKRVFVYTLLFFFQNTGWEGKKAVSQAIQNMINNFCYFTDIRALGEKWFPYRKLKLLRQIP